MERIWRDARSIGDLGGAMAGWLEGHIASRPGHALGEPARPDAETEHLVPVLARLCRRGYVTTGSQPGLEQTGHDDPWEQRAYVEGCIATGDRLLLRLVREARAAGLFVSVHGAGRSIGPRKGFTVTRQNGEPRGSSGGRHSWYWRRSILPGVGRRARRQLRREGAWVAIVDPEWGRDDRLWDMLEQVCARECRAQNDPGVRAVR